MAARASFYWHDYETWGRDPALDRPAQFAGLRTDDELRVIGEPLVLFCQPAADVLPDPEACLITGITPQRAEAEGVPEYAFIRRIHDELAQPGTCGVGYNSIRFDDEFTRYTLYRNFYDPYAREWQNGNSRWDLIDAVRLAAAVRPEGLQWPRKPDGTPSFRLEDLTAANGIAHAGAHDALVDVQATIELARRLKAAQPKLWQWVLDNRPKHAVAAMLDPAKGKPVLHVSSRFGADRHCMAMVLPLCWHPTNKNSVIVYDLSEDPEPLLALDADAIRERVFTAREQLPAGAVRIPLKQVHINKAPVVVPVGLLDEPARERTRIDPQACERHRARLAAAPGLAAKVQAVFAQAGFAPATDPDAMLYSGGFFSDHDRRLMNDIRRQPPQALAGREFPFEDARLETLLWRYRARNFPQTLSAGEQAQWDAWCQARLGDPAAGGPRVLAGVRQQIAALRQRDGASAVLDALEQWLQGRVPPALWAQAGGQP